MNYINNLRKGNWNICTGTENLTIDQILENEGIDSDEEVIQYLYATASRISQEGDEVEYIVDKNGVTFPVLLKNEKLEAEICGDRLFALCEYITNKGGTNE